MALKFTIMTLQKALLLLWLLGVWLFLYSQTLPLHWNQNILDGIVASDHIDTKLYYEKEKEWRTYKLLTMDIGSGLILTSITLLVFFAYFRIQTFSDLKKLKTLDKSKLFILSNIAYIMELPGDYWYYYFRLERWDYPVFADSLGIPLRDELLIFGVCFTIFEIFLLLMLYRTHLPTKLFYFPEQYTLWKILWEIFFTLFLLLSFVDVFLSIISGDHFYVPIHLFFFYMILSLRVWKLSH